MATTFSLTSSITLHHNHRSHPVPTFDHIVTRISPWPQSGEPKKEQITQKPQTYQPQNVVEGGERIELCGDGVGITDISIIVETIKQDFQRSYFVIGALLMLDAYEDDYEFSDPAGSQKGLGNFSTHGHNFVFLCNTLSKILGPSVIRSSRENFVEGSGRIELGGDGVGVIDRSLIVETIKHDFQRSYFVTGIT
ncbi:hypothetical protein CTI12_AA326460 [Artemisia annua]|uniref:Uncharacterized protein n=1 Tax=Artemisia annua TaxID=35608 RepID=A0A2U1MZ53_ARTAN|nr:hypothetical protein CTI12_AA326460 [Artemisia annua]